MDIQDLNLVGDGAAIARLMDAITGNPAMGSWRRVPEKEALAAQVLDGVHFAFEHRGGPLPDAGLLLGPSPRGAVMVNIVRPDLQSDRLEIADQRDLVANFAERLGKVARAHGVAVELIEPVPVPPGQFLERLPGDLRRALEAFVTLANSSSLHFRDLQRWREFLIGLHSAGIRLDTGQLVAWIVLVHGWPHRTVERIAGQLEFARDILALYDARRGEHG